MSDSNWSYLSPDEMAEFEQLKAEKAAREAAVAAAAPKPINYDEDPDPREVALQAGHERIKAGGTREDALAVTFDTMIAAAIRGDRRAIIDRFNDDV
jgi:hypothetical protein